MKITMSVKCGKFCSHMGLQYCPMSDKGTDPRELGCGHRNSQVGMVLCEARDRIVGRGGPSGRKKCYSQGDSGCKTYWEYGRKTDRIEAGWA